jgi:nucleoside-diphosphate-sugar epimerase
VRVLVTGGAGNLAKYCDEELRRHGHDVTLFDRRRPEDGVAPWSTDTRLVQGEMTSLDDCMNAVEAARAEAVINLGGIPGPTEIHPPDQPRRPNAPPDDETFRVNVMGTFYVLDAARRQGVKVVAHASTMSTLGISPRIGSLPIPVKSMPVDESHPFWSENTYSLSKVLNEEMLLAFSRAYGMRAVALRMMHVYMPHWGDEHRAIFRFGEPARPNTPGNFTVWEYLDARDAAQGYRLAIEKNGLDLFEPFFLATDRSPAEEHRVLAEQNYPHLAEEARRMGPDDLILSIRRARERLGYAPTHSWRGAEANARVN